MKYLWLNKNNNKNLIVFFNGWAMDENAVKHLEAGNYDIITVYDYRILDNFPEINFELYKNKYLITWSFGTVAANMFYNKFKNFTERIALNGTFFPCHNKYGINEKIYNLTVNNLNESSLNKFIKRMFYTEPENILLTSRTDIAELKEELIAIPKYKPDNFLNFSKAFISKYDKIITAANQKSFWATQKNIKIVELETGHYPFYGFSDWSQIINA